MGSIEQARSALSYVNHYTSAPDWWGGSLKELHNAVIRGVKKEYPSIEISEQAKKPKKAGLDIVLKAFNNNKA